jgi:hypothetical protein
MYVCKNLTPCALADLVKIVIAAVTGLAALAGTVKHDKLDAAFAYAILAGLGAYISKIYASCVPVPCFMTHSNEVIRGRL